MNCTAPLASLMCNTLCIMQHALSTELITMLIPPSIWSCISALVFLTTNCSGVSRWHNDCGMSVTDGKNMLQMVWKWEVRLCHKEPQWSRPEGIQMASTWTPLTAQLDGEEVGGENSVVWTEGRCVYICVCINQRPPNVQFIHINE